MQVNEAGQHEGVVKGRSVRFPRVTSIIGDFLCDWDAVPEYNLKKACNFGRAVHDATQFDDEGTLRLVTLAPPLWPYLKAWRKFKADYDVEIEEIEPVIYSAKYGFAGRADRIGIVKGVRSVIEIKSRIYIPLTDDLQTVGYQGGWNEMNPRRRALRRYLVELRADGTYGPKPEIKQAPGQPEHLAIFLSALGLYKWRELKK
jgi:hypothetical protein